MHRVGRRFLDIDRPNPLHVRVEERGRQAEEQQAVQGFQCAHETPVCRQIELDVPVGCECAEGEIGDGCAASEAP
jgi:hypothetical protein